MDTAITTTTNQCLSTTNVHTLSISNNNSNSVDSIVQYSSSSFIKNKRKNFSPRHSAMTNDKNIDNLLTKQQQIQQSSSPSQIKENLIKDELLTVPSTSMNIPSSSLSSSSSSSSSLPPSSVSSLILPVEQNKISNINSAIKESILKQFGDLQKALPQFYLQKSGKRAFDEFHHHTSSNIADSATSNSYIHPIAENLKHILEFHRQHQTALGTSESNNTDKFKYKINPINNRIEPIFTFNETGVENNSDRKHHNILGDSKPSDIEYAYNAFNAAVQDLLNVYELSISPGEIVEAFKKLNNLGGCPQPPTPPRTPVSTSAIPSCAAGLHGIDNFGLGTTNLPPSSLSLIPCQKNDDPANKDKHFPTSTIKKIDNCEKFNEKTTEQSSSSSSQLSCSTTSTTSSVITSTTTAAQNSHMITLAPLSKLIAKSSLAQDFQKQFQMSIMNRNSTVSNADERNKTKNFNDDNGNDDKDNVAGNVGSSGSGADAGTDANADNNIKNMTDKNECTRTINSGEDIGDNDDDGYGEFVVYEPKIAAYVCSDSDITDSEDDHNENHKNKKQMKKRNRQLNDRDHDRRNIDGDDDDDDDDDDDEDEDDNNCDDVCSNNKRNVNKNNDYTQNMKNHNKLKYVKCSKENINNDNSSDSLNSPHTQFDNNCPLGNDDSNISVTGDLQSCGDSDELGSNSGALTNLIDYDSATNTTTRLPANKNVENLLDKCSLGLFSPFLQLAQLHTENKQLHVESVKNLTKFSSYIECKNEQCQHENLREHYHCYDEPCFGKILSKKEEIIRHMKWHKKRSESLNHGFLRFSSSDDCSTTFGQNCTHNRKQTHYHCFQPNCDKIYISTSDVQMHSNYHRKDSAIYQEGFQRYRANEECNADYCVFSGQKTTHFHCRRDNCQYTFKNKADMEKHKTYHIKDLQLAQDGFKKFLKTEACPFGQCRFSRIVNHIHCVRDNCYYVLHSSGQLLSHKRKHERMDSEQAYRRFRMIQKAAVLGQDISQITKNFDLNSKSSTPSTPPLSAMSPESQMTNVAQNILTNTSLPSDLSVSFASSTKSSLPSEDSDIPNFKKSDNSPIDLSLLYNNSNTSLGLLQEIQHRPQPSYVYQSPDDSGCASKPSSTVLSSMLPSISSNISSQNNNSMIQDNVLMSMMLANSSNFGEDNNVRPNPETLENIISQYFTSNCTRQNTGASSSEQFDQQIEPLNLNLKNSTIDSKQTEGKSSNETIECFLNTNEAHLHCLIKDCEAVILHNINDIAEHLRMHKLNRNVESIMQNSNLLQITSIEGFFNRKRGRPPKNRVVEVYNNNTQQSPQAIFTSFKLEKHTNENLPLASPAASHCMNTRSMGPITATPTTNTTSSTCNDHNTNSPVSEIHHPMMTTSSVSSTLCSATNQSSSLINFEKKFRFFGQNENCGTEYCTHSKKMHFHCNANSYCQFVTQSGLAMDLHVFENHKANSSNTDSFSNLSSWINNPDIAEKFQYFNFYDICSSDNCNNKKLREHLHCIKCQKSVNSQTELQAHLYICYSCGPIKLYSNNDNDKPNLNPKSPIKNISNIKNFEMKFNDRYQNKFHDDSGGSTSSVDCTSPIKKPTVDEVEVDCSSKYESSEDEHVSVVRASGTYFPQNSETPDKSVLCETDESQNQSQTDTCQRSFCKLKRKIHDHCETCNQAFSDKAKLKLHRLKHSSTKLNHPCEIDVNKSSRKSATEKESVPMRIENSKNIPSCMDSSSSDQPQDLSLITYPQQLSKTNTSPVPVFSSPQTLNSPNTLTNSLHQMLPQNFMDKLCIQNLHLAQMALYQQNPFYYQNFYPFLNSQSLNLNQTELFKSQLELPFTSKKSPPGSSGKLESLPSGQFALSEAAAAAAVAAVAATVNTSGKIPNPESNNLPNIMMSPENFAPQKRGSENYDGSLMQPNKLKKINKMTYIKIFKDEPIPYGYLKFRFNEDCNFPNCGYRNHQSHFHCCRNDCYYSFCDKTRFVQHTTRHERLDKLMGDDFKQFRAGMRCGYEDCVYNKNLVGQNNKSSHFHCLKCDFICSDTNKVVAHRRQHSKMEFIRMAGFRKVANNEKCTKSSSSDQEPSNNGDCTYSLKQTHYHCLVCDCSVLSRAQLASHRHRNS